jgi:hypothetical protein
MKMTRLLGLAAVGAVLALAAPTQQAQALSLANPASVSAIQDNAKASAATTEVRWHRRWHRHWRRHW